ncbi:HtaA protein [Corynebacterium phocae]|nr:HtaA protein [Corynebacterium phocae]
MATSVDLSQAPTLAVTDQDGNPIIGSVQRGDVLLVHGKGFDPNANREGFPMPIPNGVPNGLFVLYSGLEPHWEPSKGASPESRKHPHDRMAWVMPAGSLETIPKFPVNMHRVIRKVAQPMNADGTFTARLVVDPPEKPAGQQWGVYVYPAAGSVNAREEVFVPIPFNPEPGPNTEIESADLLLDAQLMHQVTGVLRGSVNPKNGAMSQGTQTVSFTRQPDEADPQDNVVRYRGTVILGAKFNAVEFAIADPWFRPLPQGGYELSAKVTDNPLMGVDSMHRRVIGTIPALEGRQQVSAGFVPLGHVRFS